MKCPQCGSEMGTSGCLNYECPSKTGSAVVSPQASYLKDMQLMTEKTGQEILSSLKRIEDLLAHRRRI